MSGKQYYPWPKDRLGNHATVKARLGWKGLKAEEYLDDGYIFLASPNISGATIDYQNVDYISKKRYEESPEIMLQKGDVLLVKDGSTLGTANIVRHLPAPATVNGSIAVLRPRTSLVPSFLFHYVKGRDFQKLIAIKKGGLGVPHLFQADLREFRLPIPPLPEQRRIAEILDMADEAIRQTEALIAKLLAMKQGLLHDLLTRGLDEHGELRPPSAETPDSPLGKVPKGWEVSPLSTRSSVLGGKRLPFGHSYSTQATEYRYLRVLNFFEKEIDFADLEHLNPTTFHALERYEIEDGHLYISIAGSLGSVGAFRPPGGFRTILTENAARIVLTDGSCPEFVAYQAQGQAVQRQIEAEKGTGGGVPKLALFRIENLLFAFPSRLEQDRIVRTISAHDARIRSEEATRDKLVALKKGLMEDLLTGRKRVI